MVAQRLLPFASARTIQVAATFLAITSLLFVFKLYSRPPPATYQYTDGKTSSWGEWNETSRAQKSPEVAYLSYLVETYGLTKDVPWFARRIQASYGASKRLSMTEIRSKFMPGDFAKARASDDHLRLRVEKSITLPLTRSARPDQIDAGGLLIGISTTFSRLSYSNFSLVADWERWMTDGQGNSNGANLLLTLHKGSAEEVRRASKALKDGGIEARVLAADMGADTYSRYADLIRRMKSHNSDLLKQNGSGAKYLALVDDDIFFASMAKMVRRLSKFSPSKEFYIGAPSDWQSDWVVESNTTMTYGGGAVFITLPMAEQLARLPCLAPGGQVDEPAGGSGAQWDEQLYRCVVEHTKAGLHVLPSFYTPKDEELYGAAGASNQGYAGGIQPLTLHHYKNWHRFEAGRGHQVTSACGEDCFLQRFRFRDDWVLVNGYTMSHYPDGVKAVALREKTAGLVWPPRQPQEPGSAKGRSVGRRLIVDELERPSNMKVVAWRGPKRTWRLLDSRQTASGEVWQAYVKRRGAANAYGDLDDRIPGDKVHTDDTPSNEDSVIVLIWGP